MAVVQRRLRDRGRDADRDRRAELFGVAKRDHEHERRRISIFHITAATATFAELSRT